MVKNISKYILISSLFYTLPCIVSANNDMSLILSGAIQKSKFTNSENDSKTDGFSTMAGLSKKFQNAWSITGLLGYSTLDTDFSSDNKDVDTDVNTYGLIASKSLGEGKNIALSAVFGKISLDISDVINNTQSSSSSDVDTRTISGVFSQIVPINNLTYSNLSFAVNNTASDTRSYTDLRGNDISSSKNNMTYFTFGIQQNFVMRDFLPNINLQYNVSDESFSKSVDDKDYYRYGLGFNKVLTSDTIFGLNLNKTYGQENISSNTLSLNIIKNF